MDESRPWALGARVVEGGAGGVSGEGGGEGKGGRGVPRGEFEGEVDGASGGEEGGVVAFSFVGGGGAAWDGDEGGHGEDLCVEGGLVCGVGVVGGIVGPDDVREIAARDIEMGDVDIEGSRDVRMFGSWEVGR